jgi:Haloacid dehalogenase-like hydrolase
MAVKAVILDLDGTLIDRGGKQVAGIAAMLFELRRSGLKVAIASNRPGALTKLQTAGIAYDLLLTKSSVGANKGSPIWVATACSSFGLSDNEVVWLGDGDLDMRSAVNGGVILFAAVWSDQNFQWGIPVGTPDLFRLYLNEFFTAPAGWYYQLSSKDTNGNTVETRALIDGSGAGIQALKSDLLGFLKYGSYPTIGRIAMPTLDFMTYHILSSVYADGLYRTADTWTIYPGSRGGANPALSTLAGPFARLFRDRFVPDLLERHTRAKDQGETRQAGGNVDWTNQFNTIRLNPQHRQRIDGKRIRVIDDFITQGFSAECARILLTEGGATEVVVISIGKYGTWQWVASKAKGYTWDPYTAVQHPPRSFSAARTSGTIDQEPLATVRESYQQIASY